MVEYGFDGVISSGVSKPTSMQFGVAPGDENTLYVAQQNGLIKVYDVTSETVDVVDEDGNVVGQTQDYSANQTEVLDLIKNMPTFNDDGTLSSENKRQVTGIVVAEEDGETVIYVSSSDPRIGGGSEFDDQNVDTNSGVLSKLYQDENGDWQKVDLLRGLPRSEENHSVNGMVITPDGKMLMAVGGFTNAGAPSNNLVYTPEYFLSAAIIEIDLPALNAMPVIEPTSGPFVDHPYVYDLPTLDIKGNDFDHPFGGDNGFNQAYLEPDGPVEIYSTGYRNNYDLALIEDPDAPEGYRLYTFDNGPNNSWGGPATDADGVSLTNSDGTAPNPDAGPATNRPNETNSNPLPASQDQLILVERGDYHGHPNPSRANPSTALYEVPGGDVPFGKAYDEFILDDQGDDDPDNDVLLGLADFLPKDENGDPIDPLNGYQVDPLEGVYLKPQLGGGSVDETLVLSNASTNGLFVFQWEEGMDPALQEYHGDIFAAAFDEQILRVDMDETGTIALNRDDIEDDEAWQTSPGNNPLDIIQGPDGSIWVASHGGNSIFAYVPGGVSEGESDNIDDDFLTNSLDPFGYDPENGKGSNSFVGTNDRWVWEFNNSVATPNGQEGWTLGLTGHMSNFIDDHFNDVVALSGVLDGGIAGRLQIEFDAVGSGSPIGTDNDATYFLQTGVTIGGSVDEFVVESTMLNPWASSGGAIDGDNLGVHWGSGTQFDFVYLAAEIQNGVGQITMTIELNDEIYYSQTYAAPGLTDIANNSTITLRTHVDVVNGTVTPTWSYETDDAAGGANGVVFGTGQSVSLDDDGDPNTQNVLEEVISGTYNVRNAPVDGEPGDPIFGQFFSGVPSGIAIGVGGARGSTAQTPPTSFAPEFDDLVFATSKANGNFEPVANGDGFGGATVGETFTIAVADLLANDVDYDIGDALTVTGVSNPSGGTVSLANGVVSFTPSAAGANSFDYTVSDGQNASTATVIVSTDAGGGGGPAREVVYRINAGGPEVAAIDGGPNWAKSTKSDPSPYLTGDVQAGALNTDGIDLSLVDAGKLPEKLFEKDHYDATANAIPLSWSFPVEVGETYEINLWVTENSDTITDRLYDVAVEGAVPTEFDDIAPYAEGGNAPRVASLRTYTYTATDASLDLEFVTLQRLAQVHAIEIVKLGDPVSEPDGPVVSLGADQTLVESGGQMLFDLSLDDGALNTDGVTVTLRILDGAAQAGVDFTVANAVAAGNDLLVSVDIPAGQAAGQLAIDLIDRPGEQPSRAFTVAIEGVSGSSATVDAANDDATGLITDDDQASGGGEETILYRVNVGGEALAAVDDGPDWEESSKDDISVYSVGESIRGGDLALAIDLSNVDAGVAPSEMFNSHYWDNRTTPEAMHWAFAVETGKEYRINLYFAETQSKFNETKIREFDFTVDGVSVAEFQDVNPYLDGGGQTGGASMRSAVVTAADGLLDIVSAVDQQNPLLSGIEIIEIGDDTGGGTPGSDAVDDAILAVAGAGLSFDPLENDAAGATLDSVGGAGQGSVVIENGALLYTPNQGASGTDSFTYTITANGQQSTATVSVDLLQPIGALSTAAGNAVGTGAGETIVGSHFAQRLKGQAGDDLLLGADGVDTLQGQAGADTLLGGSGDDILRGGSEGDRLDGGSGDDEMTGGGGVDVFVFRAGSGADLVTDYTAGVDLLEVGDYFASKAAALAAVSQSGADAVLTLDGTHQATLAGVQAASLTEDDFVL